MTELPGRPDKPLYCGKCSTTRAHRFHPERAPLRWCCIVCDSAFPTGPEALLAIAAQPAGDDDLLFGPIERAQAELRAQGFDPEMVRLKGEVIGLKLKLQHAEARAALEAGWRVEAQARARALADAVKHGAYAWMGDGTDDISMLDDASVVVLTAGDMRALARGTLARDTEGPVDQASPSDVVEEPVQESR